MYWTVTPRQTGGFPVVSLWLQVNWLLQNLEHENAAPRRFAAGNAQVTGHHHMIDLL
jgi:hypothetical protein